MIQQTTFSLAPKRRGCHLVTNEILANLPAPMPETGLLNLFVNTPHVHSLSTRMPILM